MEHDKISISDLSRLLDIIATAAEDGLCTPEEAVRKVGSILSGNGGGAEPGRNSFPIGNLCAQMRKIRSKRNDLFGAPLFKDPAWDMLLELFAAHEKGDDMSVTSLCYASGVPVTTALRHLVRMEKHGLVSREGDPADLRRCNVRPTAKAIDALVDTGHLLLETVRVVERFGKTA